MRFPLSSDFPKLPLHIVESKEEVNRLYWKRERLSEDVKREEILLKNAKGLFENKKQESLQHHDNGMRYMTQVQDNHLFP